MGLPPTSSKLSTDANNVTTFFYDFPNFTGTHTGVTVSLGTNSVAGGGTGVSTLTANELIASGTTTTSPVVQIPSVSAGYVLTDNGSGLLPTFQPSPGTVSAFFASSACTTRSSAVTSGTFTTFSNSPTLTFTPSITGLYKIYSNGTYYTPGGLPDSSRIFNTSGSAVLHEENGVTFDGQVYSNSLSISIYTLTAGTSYSFDLQGLAQAGGGGTIFLAGDNTPFYIFAELEATGTVGTGVSSLNGETGAVTLVAGSNITITPSGTNITIASTSSGSFTAPTVQAFTSGSGTYTTPTSPAPLYIKVTMVGGGGSGCGYTGSADTQNNGANSTFGTILTAGGGDGGTFNTIPAGGSGTNTITGGITIIDVKGGSGGAAADVTSGPSGTGGNSALGGGGASSFGSSTLAGGNGSANTGGGGGGGSTNGQNFASNGGDAGGYLQVIITSSIASTYAYTVGAGGASIDGGGAGGSGYIVVEEYYQ